VVEHPLELEAADAGLEGLRFALYVARGSLIAFTFRQLEQLGGIRNSLRGTVDLLDIRGEPCPLLA
jgi:hypothetical protein